MLTWISCASDKRTEKLTMVESVIVYAFSEPATSVCKLLVDTVLPPMASKVAVTSLLGRSRLEYKGALFFVGAITTCTALCRYVIDPLYQKN